MSELKVIPKRLHNAYCEHCELGKKIATWIIWDSKNKEKVAELCTEHKDKFMMEQI